MLKPNFIQLTKTNVLSKFNEINNSNKHTLQVEFSQSQNVEISRQTNENKIIINIQNWYIAFTSIFKMTAIFQDGLNRTIYAKKITKVLM